MKLDALSAVDIAGKRDNAKRLTRQRVRQTIFRILRKNKLCAIATLGSGGRVHINTAYFSYTSELELYFLSHPTSRHCQNIKAHPQMAIAVFDSTQTWGGQDRGLQLFGSCTATRGTEVRKAERAYARRFKPYARWKAELTPDDLASDYRLFRFVTRRIKVFAEHEFGGAMFVTANVRQ